MIVNHRYQFIFIRTRKVASTSVEIALSKYCDANDIITRMGHNDGGKIRTLLGHQMPCNWTGFEPHEPAQTAHKKLKDVWHQYYKFSIVRDPVECLISDYYWKNRASTPQSFEQFVDKCIRDKRSNWYIHAIDDKPAMDHYVLYENLTEDLNALGRKLKLPGLLGNEVSNIKEKSEYRQNRSPDISIALKQKIIDAYRPELDLVNKLKSR